MSVYNPYQQYKQTQISTASQGSLILMLYDAALRNLRIAIESVNHKKGNDAHNALLRAQDIVSELNIAPNMEAGDIAQNLRKLYTYMYTRLVEANVKKDAQIIEEVLGLMSGLQEAWAGIIRKQKSIPVQGGYDGGI
ncbi:MAG TPA: flagellar export chaperone FliS [Firmicutes bacterium]|nr:flagellar export chaperone FliS [Bacillota bacterium]